MSLLIKSAFTNSMFRLLFAGMIGCSFVTSGQDLKRSLEKMRRTYENVVALHVVMDITVYEDSLQSVPYFSERAEIMRDDKKFHYRFAANEMLLNEKYLVMVDNASREIVLNQKDFGADSLLMDIMPLVSLDSIFKVLGTPVFFGKKDSLDHYRIKREDGLIDSLDIFLDEQRGFIHEIAYRYSDGQFARIIFNVFDVSPVFRDNSFDERNYFTRVNGKLAGTQTYKNYSIITAE